MSNYIGNQPSAGEFKKLDSIASSFNGSLTQFDLDYNTVNQSVGDATQLIVSLNGIIQEPGAAYTLGIGGGSIVFASAPASGDTCHIVLLGGVGGTTTPTDGSVTASKLDASLKDYLEETFTANGSQTDFTLTRAVVGINNLLVTIDGIVQPSSAFTATGTTLTISEVLAANTDVRVVHMGVKAGVYVPANDSVTADMLANSINTDIAAGVAALPKAGGTMTGNLSLGDNNKAIFGAGSDLQIFHDGNNSFVKDAAAGDLILDTNGDSVRITHSANGETMARFQKNNKVELYYDNALKLATTNTGVDITGTVNAVQLDITAGTDAKIYTSNSIGEVGAGNFAIQSVNSAGSALKPLGFRAEDIRFATGPEERMRIDNSGNVLVGKLSADFGSSVGFEANSNDTVYATRSGGASLTLNRTTSDGDIALFRKDGTTVGSIQARSSFTTLQIGSTGTGITGTSSHKILPSVNNARSDNTNDLGDSSYRWKDLYLSGGVYLGGTGPANKLDDYEEGTWTPVDGSGNAYNNGANATYTKIGRIVYINFDVSSTGSTTGPNIAGLPFTASPSSVTGNWSVYGGYSISNADLWGHINQNSNRIVMYVGSSSHTLNGRWIGAGFYYTEQ